MRKLLLLVTHLVMLGIGFALGVYFLPILTAPKGPDQAALQAVTAEAMYKGRFERGLRGSDFLHWGEGEVRISKARIAHDGKLAPGPDYKLYLVKDYVDTREGFLKVKAQAMNHEVNRQENNINALQTDTVVLNERLRNVNRQRFKV